MAWNILVVSLSFFLSAFLIWKEVMRTNRLSLAARLIATVLAVVSLACIALPPTVKRNYSLSGFSPAIILTDGYHKDSLKDLSKQPGGQSVFILDKKIKASNARYIPDLSLLAEDSLRFSSLSIFGHGLDENQLRLIKDIPVNFQQSEIANRITSIDWNERLIAGDKLVVQGTFSNTSAKPAKIILHGFGTNLDSVVVAADRLSTFELSAFPRHIDKAVYAITSLISGDTLETNPLPVIVEAPKLLNILLLASSPDFENKFLKNWLSENEYGFAVRTSISKNKYDKQFMNIGTTSLERITPSLLEKFDVVIADLAALNNLPASDISNLRSLIDNKGIGLIVKAGFVQRASGFYLSSFPLVETRDSVFHTVKLDGGITDFQKPLKIEQPIYIRGMQGTETLIRDQQGRILVSNKLYGNGRIIVTTVPNAYAWWLNGNKDDYASYWTMLIRKAAKKIVADQTWELQPGLPRINRELKIALQEKEWRGRGMQAGSYYLPVHQNYLLPYESSSVSWPMAAGWQTLSSGDMQPAWIYIYDTDDWSGILASEKISATKKYANGTSRKLLTDKVPAPIRVEIPGIYFFILFVFSAAFLWFEKKYRNG